MYMKSFFPDMADDEDSEEIEFTAEKVRDLMYYIFHTLLYILALVMFAILPSVGNGGIAAVFSYSLIIAATVSCFSYVFNFKVVKHIGFKQTLYSICSNIIATLLTAPISYSIAVLLFR
jgi:hypothetical protein